MSKWRTLGAVLTSSLPSNPLRVAVYKHFFGYKIGKRAKIGLGVIISVDRFEAGEDVQIRRRTSFIGPMTVVLGDKNIIGRDNKFMSGNRGPHETEMNYARQFILGTDCLINDGHIFDVMGKIEICSRTWIAGYDSQFISHGAGVMERDIHIGDNCFIGSAVRFAPGSSIGSHVILGMGAVVTKRIESDNVIVGGFPAKVIRHRLNEDHFTFEKNWV